MDRNIKNNSQCFICKKDYSQHGLVDLQELGFGRYHWYLKIYHPECIASSCRTTKTSMAVVQSSSQLQRNCVDKEHETAFTKTQSTQTSSNGKQHYRNNLNLNDPWQARIAASSSP